MDEMNAADDILGAEHEKMAVLIIALDGELGESPDLVPYDAPEEDIRTWATEAISGGTIPGIDPQEVDLTNYKVRRLPAKDGLPDRVMVRPKTEVGGLGDLVVQCKIPTIQNRDGSTAEVRYIEVNTDPVRGHPEGPTLVEVVIGEWSVVVKASSLAAAVANIINA